MVNIGSQKAYHSAIKMRMEEVGEGQNIADTIELPGLKNVQSKIAVPLLVKNRLIGVFSVESSLFNAFDELDETLLVIFGNQIAGAIDNAHAYKLAEDRLDELNSANDSFISLMKSSKIKFAGELRIYLTLSRSSPKHRINLFCKKKWPLLVKWSQA